MREFFDGDIGVGKSGLGYPVFAGPEELLAYMDRYRIAKTHANLYDCTCAGQSPDWVEHEVKRCGSSTSMLVGSDFPLFCLAFGTGMIVYTTLPESDKQNILGRNALRILERISWYEKATRRVKSEG